MKKLLPLLFTLLPFAGSGQTFYVEPTTFGYEKKIYEQLRFDGFKLTEREEDADYKVECFGTTGKPYQGYVKITDAKTGAEVSKSKTISTSAYNPRHAGNKIMGKIASGSYWKKLMAPIKGEKK